MSSSHPSFQSVAFAQRLIDRLDSRQMSQSQLAAALGVSRSTITGWIRHQKLPDAYLIHGLCRVLSCSADWLLGLASETDKQDASGSIHWTEQLPSTSMASAEQEEALAQGLRYFQLIMSGEDSRALNQWPLRQAALQTLFRSQRIRNVQTIFLSASGAERRHASGEPHLLAQFRSADYISEAPELREQYADLSDKNQFGAEILRTLIDSTGQILGRDPTTGHQADLDLLRYISGTIGRVCLVAACGYKARAVLTCVRNQLVNTLIIDSEIAEYLLTH